MLPNTLKCPRFGFFLKYNSCGDTPSLTDVRFCSCLDCFSPIKLWRMLLFKHHSCCLLYSPSLLLDHNVLLWCVSAREFSLSSFLLQITRDLVGKVLFSTIGPQALDFFASFPFGKACEDLIFFLIHLQEACKDFIFFAVKHTEVC